MQSLTLVLGSGLEWEFYGTDALIYTVSEGIGPLYAQWMPTHHKGHCDYVTMTRNKRAILPFAQKARCASLCRQNCTLQLATGSLKVKSNAT